MNNISNERREIITDPIGIKSIIRTYYKQVYANNFDRFIVSLSINEN